ncbi:MAG: ATP-binding protein [Candidatus Bathyarchaeia archaeon]|jgi:predicted AAA+ superfamily ATPase
MNVEELKAVITSQREATAELFKKEKIIERDVDKALVKNFLVQPNVVAVLGVRRCGKSVFSLLLLEGEKFGYVNFFDERLAGLRGEELNKVLQAFYELYGGGVDYFVFDEVQKVEGWERFVSRLRTTSKVVITGSNAGLLRGDLATFLTGRHVDVELLPFSFREYLKASGVTLDDNWVYSTVAVAAVKRTLVEFMDRGGFPEVNKFGKVMLNHIYRDILENDVIMHYKIRKTQSLKELAKYLISNTAREVTFNKLKTTVGIKDAHTAAKYVSYISDAYLVFLLERFSYKLKEQFKAPKKVYCVDTGLAANVAFKIGRDQGRLMENMVFLELLRRKLYANLDWEIYYWKDHQGREVDFLIKTGESVKQLIQVTYASEKHEINPREIKAIAAAASETKCDDLQLITWDYEDTLHLNKKTVKCTPLWKWLLTPTKP